MFWKNKEPDPNRETYWDVFSETVHYRGSSDFTEFFKILRYKDTDEEVDGDVIEISYQEYCSLKEQKQK